MDQFSTMIEKKNVDEAKRMLTYIKKHIFKSSEENTKQMDNRG